MWSILVLGAAEKCINQLIDLDAITRIQINGLQGQLLRVVIDSPQMAIDVFFDQGKVRLSTTPTGQATQSTLFEQRPFDQADTIMDATATLHVTNLVELIKLLITDDVGNIPLQGDFRILQEIKRIIDQAEPDLAAQLSLWVGPALAHEISKIQKLPKQIKRSVSSHLFFAQDALKEDSGLFALRWQMDDLNQDTRIFNQNLDRAEAKIQRLQQLIETLPKTPHN
ncbi:MULTISPECIES: hypothetical protein [unclassified Acinetobacter]|uniref:ubiquinone biosynthesis accessory factor UbiJ n=1 Tax=unclassified Acinetobacter TaxID=196816 RepID=UPI0029351796|nr:MULTISPECIES: hypothetical protein [unclassified Acinetobacter]WOE30592.1 hypothetical protein QSG84_09345 [Acinetobacter sp. SAAs470]WOE38784.1 hypothetical protein QSG86_03010 [Acinetobacter sp. SAAs474]